jgi:hypothetical protein
MSEHSGAAVEMPSVDSVFFALLFFTVGILIRRLTARLFAPTPPPLEAAHSKAE